MATSYKKIKKAGNSSLSAGVRNYDAPEVVGVDINDPEGQVPIELITKGLEVVVKRWENFPDKPPRKDRLRVAWEFADTKIWVFDDLVYPIPPERIIIKIDPGLLTEDGVAYVSYEVLLEDLNVIPSARRKLTIDSAAIDLLEPTFPSAGSDGYLNCDTDNPPLWVGVRVKVLPDPGFALQDVLIVHWEGYKSLNGSGPPIANTYKEIRKSILTQEELEKGIEVLVEPFVPHIEPMINKASALARYSLERNGRVTRKSKVGLVRIDRIIPGEEEFCGPP
ncbi:hypothetical protein [Pseudomonas fluorescens]|uniref:Uncharacterized protein n=1 Tax=Pseudomonas fluorescens TaxID=294 RepID=A0A5E7JRD3_PSEFL|nr:hypothetical protein [Pseudomonas fluorescens]VVO90454.1 hypothetical protein PS880_02276 [Pseudomonas fluorescens]